jgi:ubiquinone/menaquinone biosynthesis C-methylase UbiE
MEDNSVRMFDEHAREYDSWYLQHSSIFESEARAIEALRPTGLGLEVGVGTGVFARRLGVGVGVDPSPGMLQLAKSRGVQVVRAVAEHLPFRGQAFDFVLLAGTLCFVKEPNVTVRESRKVLNDNGTLIVCEVPRDSPWGKLMEEKGRAGHRFYRHAKLYTTKEVRHVLQNAGFNVIDAIATLASGPEEPERLEEPSDNTEGRSYICLLAVKT